MNPDVESVSDGSEDLRGDIGAALDKLGATPAADAAPAQDRTDATEPNDTPAGESDTDKAARARDDKGRFEPGKRERPRLQSVKPKPENGAAPGLENAIPPDPKAATSGQAPAVSTPPPPELKAPASLTPKARAEWGKVPRVVQEDFVRRDRETSVALQRATETLKQHSQFQEVVRPFENSIRSRGGDVLPTISNLLRTAEALYSGPPHIKAQLVANVIKSFGVPIESLAAALEGAPQAEQQPQQFRDPRLDNFIAQQEQERLQRTQALQERFSQDARSWAEDKPYANDVKQDMADLMEVAARRGVHMDFDEAYARAIQLHPDIRELEEQRQEAEAAQKAQASTEQIRAASSSIVSEPAGGVSPDGPEGLRGDVEKAWSRHAR